MRQVFGDEFKREAIRLARTSGLTQERVATDLGIGKSTLAKWVQADAKMAVSGAYSALADVDLLKENERLRQENRVLREEREILKKATVFFVSQK